MTNKQSWEIEFIKQFRENKNGFCVPKQRDFDEYLDFIHQLLTSKSEQMEREIKNIPMAGIVCMKKVVYLDDVLEILKK